MRDAKEYVALGETCGVTMACMHRPTSRENCRVAWTLRAQIEALKWAKARVHQAGCRALVYGWSDSKECLAIQAKIDELEST